MSAINKVKELLADADSNECFTSERASNQIRELAGPIAQALVESQEALKKWDDSGYECRAETCQSRGQMHLRKLDTEMFEATRAALRMDGLVKAMEG